MRGEEYMVMKPFRYGWSLVNDRQGMVNYINKKMELISPDKWWESGTDFYEGTAVICDKDTFYRMDGMGRINGPVIKVHSGNSIKNGTFCDYKINELGEFGYF